MQVELNGMREAEGLASGGLRREERGIEVWSGGRCLIEIEKKLTGREV